MVVVGSGIKESFQKHLEIGKNCLQGEGSTGEVYSNL